MSIGVDAPAVPQAMGAGAGAGRRPALDPAWYDAIAARRSRRRYSDRAVAARALNALRAFEAAVEKRGSTAMTVAPFAIAAVTSWSQPSGRWVSA